MAQRERRKKPVIEKIRPAGRGGDGEEYGVTRLRGGGGKKSLSCAKPCPTCPWRTDAEIGRFPPEAYRISANTAYDQSLSTFACHETGPEVAATCAGFLLANSDHNIGVRLAQSTDRLDISRVANPDNVELYPSYRDMAIANGVDPDDPRIAACRGNDESGADVYERVRRTGAYRPRTTEELISYMNDDDEHHLT